jgi:hypothetical protein
MGGGGGSISPLNVYPFLYFDLGSIYVHQDVLALKSTKRVLLKWQKGV